jgi:hypothetical protein
MTNNNKRLITSLLGLALAACGDNGRALPDAGAFGPSLAVIVAGDFTPGHPGILTVLDSGTLEVRRNAAPAMAVGSDPILRHVGRELLIVNRGENNITILDDRNLRFKEQLGTGDGSNPQDVAVVGDKLYVATFQGRGLTVLTRGSTDSTVVDLSADDPDGEPNCNSVYAVGGLVYVSCERFDPNFVPRGPGKVYVVDTATDALRPELTVTLGHQNPFGLFEQIPDGAPNAGDLLIPTVGDFTPAAGCIERVATGSAPAAAGCVLENAMIRGYPTRIAFQVDAGAAMMWTAVAVPQPPTEDVPSPPPLGDLRGFDLATSALWDAPISPSTEIVADVANCPSGQVIVVDSTRNANGLRVYQNAAEVTTAALPIGLGLFSSHGLVCY